MLKNRLPFLSTVSTWKMALRRWMAALEAAAVPRQAQVWCSKLCRNDERASCIAATATSRCRRSRCLETVRSPARGKHPMDFMLQLLGLCLDSRIKHLLFFNFFFSSCREEDLIL